MNQEMGPGKIEVRVIVSAKVIIDEDDLEPMRRQRWDDTLSGLQQNGIPINKRVEISKEK